MTWNLWWRFGPWEQRQAAIEAVLRDVAPDVVCLQEVWAEEGGANQAAVLAGALGFHHAAAPTPFVDGVAFTNAVLSRWPIETSAVERLPGPDGRPGHRVALVADVASPWGRAPVISTHLAWEYDASATRSVQAVALCRLASAHRGDPDRDLPVVVGGDLNAVPDSDEVRALTGRAPVPVPGLVFQDAWEVAGDGPGHTWDRANPYLADATWPGRRLDYLLVSWPRPRPRGNPQRCWLAGTEPVEGVQPSDHYAVVADIATVAVADAPDCG